MTQDDDWSARMARLVAREVRRYREAQRPKMSTQKLADRTDELGMPIARSVLANLESGRRETVSVAEIVILAAALNISPVELMCPVGYDKEAEILPGRVADPLEALRWFTGGLKLDLTEASVKFRQPGTEEQSSTYLVEYHHELVNRLRMQEYEAARAAADAASAAEARQNAEAEASAARMMAADAEAGGEAVPADLASRLAAASAALATAVAAHARATQEMSYRMMTLTEWRDFIREPLARTRAEMRRRGMLLPDLPPGIDLGEADSQ